MESYLGNPNLKKVNQPKEWTQKEIEEYQKCMDDPLYFIETYIKIVSLDEGLVPFKPYNFGNGPSKSILLDIEEIL